MNHLAIGEALLWRQNQPPYNPLCKTSPCICAWFFLLMCCAHLRKSYTSASIFLPTSEERCLYLKRIWHWLRQVCLYLVFVFLSTCSVLETKIFFYLVEKTQGKSALGAFLQATSHHYCRIQFSILKYSTYMSFYEDYWKRAGHKFGHPCSESQLCSVAHSLVCTTSSLLSTPPNLLLTAKKQEETITNISYVSVETYRKISPTNSYFLIMVYICIFIKEDNILCCKWCAKLTENYLVSQCVHSYCVKVASLTALVLAENVTVEYNGWSERSVWPSLWQVLDIKG